MRPQRLLIVEGDVLTGKELAEQMEGQGFVVKVVESINKGLEVLESNSDFDLILANLNQITLRQISCGKAQS